MMAIGHGKNVKRIYERHASATCVGSSQIGPMFPIFFSGGGHATGRKIVRKFAYKMIQHTCMLCCELKRPSDRSLLACDIFDSFIRFLRTLAIKPANPAHRRYR